MGHMSRQPIPKLFVSFHMTSVAWLLCRGGAARRTHLSGVAGDYDWVAACRAPEVIQSAALISTMTIVAPHPTPTPTPPPTPPNCSHGLRHHVVGAVFGAAAVAPHVAVPRAKTPFRQITHTFSKSPSDTYCACFFRRATQLARKVATFRQCVTLWVKPFELVVQTACLNRAAKKKQKKKQVFILLAPSLLKKRAIKINNPNETIMVFGNTS